MCSMILPFISLIQFCVHLTWFNSPRIRFCWKAWHNHSTKTKNQSSSFRISSINVNKAAGNTVQKNEVSVKDFFSKCDQIRRKLRIWSHLLKKSLMENFIFCAVLGYHWYKPFSSFYLGNSINCKRF